MVLGSQVLIILTQIASCDASVVLGVSVRRTLINKAGDGNYTVDR